jgi:D-glycero-beta-D-manno-heptose 1-phosphate adenylyltransferase
MSNWKQRLIPQSHLSDLHEKLKEKGKKIVFTAGGWDMLHVGQTRYLEEARALGDILVVGVNSNTAIRKVKGKNKPLIDEMMRAEMLTFLKSVDFVTIVPEPSCQPSLATLKPDVYVTVKEDWAKDYKDSIEYKTVNKYGGEVVVIDRQSPFISTTQIIQRAIGAHLQDVFKEFMELKDKPLKERRK